MFYEIVVRRVAQIQLEPGEKIVAVTAMQDFIVIATDRGAVHTVTLRN